MTWLRILFLKPCGGIGIKGQDKPRDKDTNKSCRGAKGGHPPVGNFKMTLTGSKD